MRTRDGDTWAATDARRDALSPANLNLLRRADAAGQRLFRELVASRIAWASAGEVSRLIAVDVVAFSLRDSDCDHPEPCHIDACLAGLTMRAVLGNRTPRLPGLRLAPGAGIGGRVLQDGRALAVADYRHEAAAGDDLLELTAGAEGIGAMVCVPVSFGGVVRGVLHAGVRRCEPFGPGPIEALTRVATYAGAAIAAAGDRARLERVAAMRERRRLARLLHDDFAQRLFSIGVSARVARERAATGHPDLMDQLHRVEREVGTAAGALRATMRGLDTPDTPVSSLAVTLREDLGAFERRTGTPAHLVVIGDAPAIEGARTDALVRAAREGLRNVERHADAGEVVVTLCTDTGTAEVAVQDDGVGAGDDAAGTGMGLRGLRDEFARLGGGLRLARNDDVGATLRMWLPLR